MIQSVSQTGISSCLHVHKSESNLIKVGSASRVAVCEAGGEGVWAFISVAYSFSCLFILNYSDDRHFD